MKHAVGQQRKCISWLDSKDSVHLSPWCWASNSQLDCFFYAKSVKMTSSIPIKCDYTSKSLLRDSPWGEELSLKTCLVLCKRVCHFNIGPTLYISSSLILFFKNDRMKYFLWRGCFFCIILRVFVTKNVSLTHVLYAKQNTLCRMGVFFFLWNKKHYNCNY